jgi:hypothetical protein
MTLLQWFGLFSFGCGIISVLFDRAERTMGQWVAVILVIIFGWLFIVPYGTTFMR